MEDRSAEAWYWPDPILEQLPSGVDHVQVERCLALTPTERLERMRQLLASLDEVRVSHDARLPRPDRSPR